MSCQICLISDYMDINCVKLTCIHIFISLNYCEIRCMAKSMWTVYFLSKAVWAKHCSSIKGNLIATACSDIVGNSVLPSLWQHTTAVRAALIYIVYE